MMISPEKQSTLVEAARKARRQAYAEYSSYPVGAALLAKSGVIYTGVNVENAVFPLTICAERTAVFKAVSEGEREFEALAVVTRDGGSPCGSCRQVLAEFGWDILVLIADEHGVIHQTLPVKDLLPHAFGAQNLASGG